MVEEKGSACTLALQDLKSVYEGGCYVRKSDKGEVYLEGDLELPFI